MINDLSHNMKESQKDKNKDKDKDKKVTPPSSDDIINDVTSGDYKYGFVTNIDTEIIPQGLNEDVVRLISQKKGEPE